MDRSEIYAIIYIYYMYILYIYIYIYIYIYLFKQMPTFNVLFKIYGEKATHNLFKITNISLLFGSFINVKWNYKQKYRLTQQHNKSKLEILTIQKK